MTKFPTGAIKSEKGLLALLRKTSSEPSKIYLLLKEPENKSRGILVRYIDNTSFILNGKFEYWLIPRHTHRNLEMHFGSDAMPFIFTNFWLAYAHAINNGWSLKQDSD